MTKIALCMIAGPWYEEFEEAIKSADGLYDYLCVTVVRPVDVDVDDTWAVAERYADVINSYYPKWDKPFIDDFSAARNTSLDLAPEDADWVFILDTDDRVVDPLRARQAIITHRQDRILLGKVQSLDEHGSFMQYRAWPRGTAEYTGRIHNQLRPYEVMEADYLPDIHIVYTNREFSHRYERNLAIIEDMGDDNLGPSEWFYKGEMLYIRAKQEKRVPSDEGNKAMEYMKKAVEMPDCSDSIKYNAYYMMSDYHLEVMRLTDGKEGDLETPKGYILELFRLSTFLREPYYLMGRLHGLAGQYEHAVWWLRHSIEMPEEVVFWHISANIRAWAMESLARMYLVLGQEDLAARLHGQARYYNPGIAEMDPVYEKFKFQRNIREK